MVSRVVVVRAVAAAVVVAAAALAGAGPAGAKGPTDVAIAEPGGPPIELSASDPAESQAVHELAEDLGVWEFAGDVGNVMSAPPTEHLGPALTVEWTMYNAVPHNPDYAPRVVQTLFPYAAGGALVHTEAGQRYFASDLTPGGWRRVPARVGEVLADIEISAEVVVPVVDPGPAATVVPAPGRGWAPLAGLAAAVVAGAVLVDTAIRRSHRGAAVVGD
jgi:hypothetical protein